MNSGRPGVRMVAAENNSAYCNGDEKRRIEKAMLRLQKTESKDNTGPFSYAINGGSFGQVAESLCVYNSRFCDWIYPCLFKRIVEEINIIPTK